MLRVIVLLLSFALYCYAQTACDNVDMSDEEKTCLVNFSSNMMKSYMSLADSIGNDTSSEAATVNAMRGAFGEVCSNEVCLNGIKKAFLACKVCNTVFVCSVRIFLTVYHNCMFFSDFDMI